MASEPVIRRYRASYAQLLRLYPRPFQEQFAEGMAQTFADLCRERGAAGKRLSGFAAGVFFETLFEILRENTMEMTEMRKMVGRVALGALAFWMIPVIAAQFIEDWHWGVGGFAFAYAVFFLTGMAYALIARRMKTWAYKLAVAMALAAGFVLGWSTMVHISETEQPIHFVYFGVLLVGAAGAALARLEARGMARALFAMAVAMVGAWLVTQVLHTDTAAGPAWKILVANCGMAGVFLTAGMLFRRASLEGVR